MKKKLKIFMYNVSTKVFIRIKDLKIEKYLDHDPSNRKK